MDLRTAGRGDGAATGAPRSHGLDFPALGRRIECRDGETVYAAARRAGVRIVGACGGRGTCGSCVVRVQHGRVHRDGESAHKKWLRACRVRPCSDLVLEVAPRSLAPIVRTDVRTEVRADRRAGGGDDPSLPHEPLVEGVEVQVAPPSPQDPASDAERLCRALPLPPPEVDARAVARLPALLREHDGRLAVRLAAEPDGRRRVIDVARPGAPLLGLAVDLGTTNAAAFLLDLRSGARLASLGLENPQAGWGADLISRLDHAIRDAGVAAELQRAAAGAIDALAHDLAAAVGATAADIVDVAVCGNTAMQHLLAGWPVAQLGRAPFVAATNAALDLPARELGIGVAPGARLHLAPSVGGFVGGDHVAALLATEPLWRQAGTTLVMDIGTNTEISLVHHDDGGGVRIVSASCPSGPALEGGHLSGGMRAAEGAIERVAIDGDALRLQVIGGGRPVGLCGSGVLDALAAFVRAGWVDARGRIAAKHASDADGQRAITLAEETPAAPAVRLTQADVRAVQLAKSAIRTGTQLLAATAGTDEAAIDRFVIAGAFGAHLGIAGAVAIGLLPALPPGRFVQVGNAAGLGVQQMLASRPHRVRAAALARGCRYVELSTRGDFQAVFLRNIAFPRQP